MSKKSNDDAVISATKEYLAKNIEQMFDDIDSLTDAKEKVRARLKLLDYVMPKVQAIRTNGGTAKSTDDFLLDEEAGL